MQVPLDAADRKLLVAAGVLLLALAGVSFLLSPAGSRDPRELPSSYSSSSGGAKAAYLLLQELGYDAVRWERPLTAHPPTGAGTVLVLAGPVSRASDSDHQALRNFLATGGRVLATGRTGALWVPDASLRQADVFDLSWRTYPATAASPVTRNTPEVTLAPEAYWRVGNPGHAPLYGNEDGTVVVTYAVGTGRVVWWAAATPLTNAGLHRKGNLTLLLDSLGPPNEIRVLWDEYYHGRTSSLWGYLSRTPLVWGIGQMALLFVGVWLTFGRRHGPVTAVAGESRLSPLEFVDTLGDLYHHAGAGSNAVTALYRRFRFLLGPKAGMTAHAAPEQVFEAASARLGRKDPELHKILYRCARAEDSPVSESEALNLIQGLHDYARMLQLLPEVPERTDD